jgi:predicted XRE-type DNA-binding protein
MSSPTDLGVVERAEEERRRSVLAKAVLRAAVSLNLSQAALAEILGVSESSVSRMKEGGYLLGPKEFELAALLVRIFRSIDALMGGKTQNVKAWFHAENDHLQGAPALLVRRIEGLTRVAQYLDFMRGAQ